MPGKQLVNKDLIATQRTSAYALQKAGLLAKVGDPGAVVVAEHVIAKDGVGDLGCMNQVHLQKSGLEVTLLRFIVLKSVEQERGRRLDHILGHKDVHDLK